MGLPIPGIRLLTPGASHTLKADRASNAFRIRGLEEALSVPNTQVRVFGKPAALPGRRMAVALSTAGEVEDARAMARQAAQFLSIGYDN
ncbi:Phosphoribosylglycinamide formyltransferase 2 [compost metagenome]